MRGRVFLKEGVYEDQSQNPKHPPYISTSWKNVISLHLEHRDGDTILIIGLVNGSTIEVPNLEKQALEAIFSAHEKYLDQESTSYTHPKGIAPIIPGGLIGETSAIMNIPLNFGLDLGMGNMLQHNSQASDSPDLPSEVLEKIASLSKVVDFGDSDNMPKPEPHCNCIHCQIIRVIRGKQSEEELLEVEDAEISEEDLRFREWDIHQSDDKLYVVTNPLNTEEHYNVFLGNPVGCTCGKPNCEHIRTVLNS